MRGDEAVRRVRKEQTNETFFIKWWRRDADVVDFELIDQFLRRVKPDEQVDDFVLLDMEEMWQVLTALDPDNLLRKRDGHEEVIEWRWAGKDGTEQVRRYPFSPESVMGFFNEEIFA